MLNLSLVITCPDNFVFIGRSKKITSKSPRGGVAAFKKRNFNIEIVEMYDNFRDCFIFKIKDSELVIIAMYIPPSNSLYYDRILYK